MKSAFYCIVLLDFCWIVCSNKCTQPLRGKRVTWGFWQQRVSNDKWHTQQKCQSVYKQIKDWLSSIDKCKKKHQLYRFVYEFLIKIPSLSSFFFILETISKLDFVLYLISQKKKSVNNKLFRSLVQIQSNQYIHLENMYNVRVVFLRNSNERMLFVSSLIKVIAICLLP